MTRISLRGALAPALIIAVCSLARPEPARAVVTSTWTIESYKDWDEGEAASAFITSAGEVKPGWSTDRAALEVETVWTALRAADGSLYLGTDDAGAIYRVRGGKAQVLAKIDGALAVVSLVQAADGTLYAGTMPGGAIWKVDAGSGKASKLVELAKAETVWALALDRAGKTLYAGTGPGGALFAVDRASGKARLAFETGDKRVMAVTVTGDGAVWLGTSEQALLFRHDPAKKITRAMADFDGNEITAIAAHNGGVVVAANEFQETPADGGVKSTTAVRKALKKGEPGHKPTAPEKDSKPGAEATDTTAAEAPRRGARKGKGALYRVGADGRIQQLHALAQTYFTALAVTGKGAVFAGAGDKGRIYLVDTDDSVSTAFDVEERLIAAMVYDDRTGMAFVTGDAAALYQSKGRATKATYTSKVLDAKAPAQFGKLVWRGEGNLVVETRTGNTAKPGVGWSEFAAARQPARGGGGSQTAKVASPSGRYIQFRVRFTGGDGALLRAAKLYYLPLNEASRVTEVTVDNPGAEAQVTLKAGAAKPRSPVLKIKWKAENPDKDKTAYKLEVRQEGDALWRQIATEHKPLTATSYDWNTETFPDGYYRVRLTASDRLSNSVDRALESEKVSGLVLVDNEKPAIDKLAIAYPRASARAVDALSPIAEMAYAVDGGPWRVGTSTDGIFDDTAEFLTIPLPRDLEPGVHTLAVRVADEAGNIGSASATFQVK